MGAVPSTAAALRLWRKVLIVPGSWPNHRVAHSVAASNPTAMIDPATRPAHTPASALLALSPLARAAAAPASRHPMTG